MKTAMNGGNMRIQHWPIYLAALLVLSGAAMLGIVGCEGAAQQSVEYPTITPTPTMDNPFPTPIPDPTAWETMDKLERLRLSVDGLKTRVDEWKPAADAAAVPTMGWSTAIVGGVSGVLGAIGAALQTRKRVVRTIGRHITITPAEHTDLWGASPQLAAMLPPDDDQTILDMVGRGIALHTVAVPNNNMGPRPPNA